MKKKALAAIKLLTGAFTPYYHSQWSKGDREVVDSWFKGANFPGAVERFEKETASAFGPGWSVRAVNLGRSGMQLALEALQIPAGSEVIISSYLHYGAATAAVQAGMAPVFADTDEQFNIRYESVMEAGAAAVKAIIISHVGGCWARDTEKIIAWARQRGIWVIEDATQSQGLMHNNIPAGVFGDAGVFSAHGDKSITSSGGGWVVTSNPRIGKYITARQLSNEPREATQERLTRFMDEFISSGAERGRKKIKQSVAPGKKTASAGKDAPSAGRFEIYGMAGVDARLIMSQLPKMSSSIRARRENAMQWRTGLGGVPLTSIKMPPHEENIFTRKLLVFPGTEGEASSLMDILDDNGIETESGYMPLYYFREFRPMRKTTMDFTEFRWRGAFSVPVRQTLQDADWKRIKRALAAAVDALK